MATKTPHSIRRSLLTRLMGPLLVVMLLGGAAAFGMSRHFTTLVLDQWLYDSAVSLGNRVKWEGGRSSIDLPPGAQAIVEWDLVDRVYYEVLSERGERLAGNAALPLPEGGAPAAAEPRYYEATIAGAEVRVVAVAVHGPLPQPVLVIVGETLQKRDKLASEVLRISIALFLVLIALSAALTWHGVRRGIASMENAVRDVRAIHRRAPLEPISQLADIPQEAVPLVEQINVLISELSAAHHLNQRFVADAAHQLRTPVASLRVQLERARRETDPELHAQAIEEGIGALTRMSHMLHQLLTLAHADETVPDGVADLDLIARHEVERRMDDSLKAQVDLGYSGPGSAVLVRGAEGLLREAVANLLDNALRYGSHRGQQVTVGVDAASRELTVEDEGPGIPLPEREKVRDRFYRMPGSPGTGCGLGLAIVSEIARRHGASLHLEDTAAGHGLRARLVFPAA